MQCAGGYQKHAFLSMTQLIEVIGLKLARAYKNGIYMKGSTNKNVKIAFFTFDLYADLEGGTRLLNNFL